MSSIVYSILTKVPDNYILNVNVRSSEVDNIINYLSSTYPSISKLKISEMAMILQKTNYTELTETEVGYLSGLDYSGLLLNVAYNKNSLAKPLLYGVVRHDNKVNTAEIMDRDMDDSFYRYLSNNYLNKKNLEEFLLSTKRRG